MGPTFVANQQAVALGIVARVFRLGVHRHQTTIGVLRLACRNPFRHDARFCVAPQVDHLGAGIRLLVIVRDGDRIELALAFGAAQDTAGVFPGDRRAGFDLGPHDFRPITAAIGAFRHEVIDAANAVFITGIPVLNGGILHLGVFFDDDFDHGGVQLGHVALRCRAAFQIRDIAALVGDDQRAFELAGVFRVDTEIGAQLHRAAHTGRDIDKRAVRKYRRIQRCIVVVGRGHDRTQVFLDQLRMFTDRFGNRTEDHAGFLQLGLKGGADGHGIKHRIHGNLAPFGGHIFGAFDPGKDHLFLQRNAKFFVCCQQLGVNIFK